MSSPSPTVDQITAARASLDVALAALTDPTPGLWFRLPDDITQRGRKVLAHYFPPFTRSIDNPATRAAGVYNRSYLQPTGENGAHAAYGGYLRDVPLFRAQDPSAAWMTNDARFDIETAKAAGIDGFAVDITSYPGRSWDRVVAARDAAVAVGAFLLVPMVDANGSLATSTPAVVADRVAELVGPASWLLPDGRVVVSCYKVEAKPVQWWTDLLAALTAKGITAAFVAVAGTFASITPYAGLTWAEGAWSRGADPATISTDTNQTAESRGRGKLAMPPVVAGDVRPRSGFFDESGNTEALRASWDKVITEGPEMVQLVTWSDFSEGTAIMPSEVHGYSILDVCAWYLTKWKTGEYPRILRDAVILTHRAALTSAPVTGGQTTFMQQWNRGKPRSTVRDTVEALTFLTAPAKVSVRVGASSYTFDAPAGMSARLCPLEPGAVSASVVRDSAVTAWVDSPVPVTATTLRDDRNYYWFSSARGVDGQRAPL